MRLRRVNLLNLNLKLKCHQLYVVEVVLAEHVDVHDLVGEGVASAAYMSIY